MRKLALTIGTVGTGLLLSLAAHATNVTLGTSFDNAPLLGAGSYSATVTLTNDDKSRYFKIEIPVGKMATIKAKYAKGDSGSQLELSILNDERKSLMNKIVGDPEEWATVRRAPGKGKDTPPAFTYYIQLSHNFVDTVINPSFTITYDTVGDLGTEQDAGGDFETATALPATSGSYTGFLASDREGGDRGDYYRLHVEKGQTFALKLTPASNAQYEIKAFNDDHEQVLRTSAGNAGQILKLNTPVSRTQDITIAILPDYNNTPTAQYQFDVTLTEGTTKKSPATSTSDDATTSGSLMKEGVYRGIGIEIVPPKKWQEIPVGDAQVLFQAPGAAGVLGKNINVNTEMLPDPKMTLATYTKESQKLLKAFIAKFKISKKESGKTKLGVEKAHRIVYTGQLISKRGPINAKWMQHFIVKNGKAYIVTFTAPPSEYKKDLKKIQEALKTFKITE